MKPVETAEKKGPVSILCAIASLLILMLLTGKSLLIRSLPVNQDEFNYLSKIYEYGYGTLTASWQSMHVHFFQWLHIFGSNEVDQVIAARILMLVCFTGTLVFIYLIARRFLGIVGSLFSVLCYISLTAIIGNGASFRSDTPAIFLIMFSLWLLLVGSRSALANVMSGLAMALALMFTIKSGIYLILFTGLFLVRFPLRGNAKRKNAGITCLAWFTGALAGGFALFYYLHGSVLTSLSAAQQGKFLANTYSNFIDLSRFFPGFEYFKMALRNNTLIWLLFAAGFAYHIIDLCVQKNIRSTTKAYMLVLVLPLLSMLVYTNTFPYFYVFIMPCAIVFCGYAVDRVMSLCNGKQIKICPILLGLLLLAISFNGILRTAYYLKNGPVFISRQREVLTVIHRIFPDPVTYIDGCRMVSSFPNAGFFMSSAGMRGYLQSDEALLKENIINLRSLFLVADVPHLDLYSLEPPKSAGGFAFRRDDWEILKSGYVHHWGPLWIMGKYFALMDGTLKQDFEITAEGLYTLESKADVFLDGRLCQNGTVVELRRGKHTVEAETSGAIVTLRWGDHLYRPNDEPSWKELFMGPFG